MESVWPRAGRKTSVTSGEGGRGDSTYVVVVEEQHDKKPKGQCHKHPWEGQVPEIQQPPAFLRGEEGFRDGDLRDVGILEPSWDMGKANPEKRGKLWNVRSAINYGRSKQEATNNIGIVSQNTPEPRRPHGALAQLLQAIHGTEIDKSNDAAQEARVASVHVKLVDQFLHTLN